MPKLLNDSDQIDVSDMSRLRVIARLQLHGASKLARDLVDDIDSGSAKEVAGIIVGSRQSARKKSLTLLANKLRKAAKKSSARKIVVPSP
jgi:hypothetical protein